MPIQKKKPKRKLKAKKKVSLDFEAGKVFTTSKVKDQDFELDLDAARFKARKGQGGDRRS